MLWHKSKGPESSSLAKENVMSILISLWSCEMRLI